MLAISSGSPLRVPLLFLLALFWISLPLQGQSLSPDKPCFPGYTARYFSDPEGALGFNRVTNLPAIRFSSNRDPQFSFGLSSATHWIRFRIPPLPSGSGLSYSNFVLYPDFSEIGNLEIYLPRHGGGWSKRRWQMMNLHRRDAPADIFPVFQLSEDLDPRREIWLRISTPHTANFKLIIESAPEYRKYRLHLAVFLTLVIGIVTAMSFYNFILFISLHRMMHLAYVGYALFAVLFQIGDTGFVNLFGAEAGFVLAPLSVTASLLSNACYLLFVWLFLDLPGKLPEMKRWFAGVWLLIAGGVLCKAAGLILTANLSAYLAAGITFITVSITAFLAMKRGNRISVFYLAAVGMLMLSMALYVLRSTGVLPSAVPVKYILFVFMALEALFSSFALADRVRRLLQENLDLFRTGEEQRRSRELAEADSQAKSAFLANMSHEIRTPLNGVIGFSRLLGKTALNPVQHHYTRNITDSARTLLSIINDILDYSKIEAGKLELDCIMTDPVDLALEAVETVKYQASGKQLELLLNLSPDLPEKILVDPVRLKQILTNLLSNAVKFTPSGEVELRIDCTADKPGHCELIFSVRDTGTGISDSRRQHIFSAFTQTDFPETRGSGGTGLGLAISEMLARKMGTRIEFESTPGMETVFHFALPVVCSHTTVSAHTPPADRFHSILIADDNRNSCAILKQAFNRSGRAVTAVFSGNAALEEIRRNGPFDLLIVDSAMPGMNGIETVRILREQLHNELTVVLLDNTADSDTVARESDGLNISMIASKPVIPMQLLTGLLTKIPGQHTEKLLPTHKMQPPDNPALRILAAEDLQINLELLQAMLQDIVPGAQITRAADGAEAVHAAAAEEPFDLILMDLQMPGMDGLEATAAIRRQEQASGQTRVPIIALTAGAVHGDRKKCLAAGMNDFLTKPVEPAELRRILHRYLPEGMADNRNPSPGTAIGEEFDLLPGINTRDGLRRISGNRRLYLELLERFASGQLAAVEALQSEITPDAVPQHAARILHTLKGAAANLGAEEISRTAAACNRSLESGATAEILPELHRISLMLKNLQAALNGPAQPETPDTPQAGPLTRQQMEAVADTLHRQLSDGDPAAAETAARLIAGIPPDICGDEGAALQQALTAYDYDRAAEALSALRRKFQ